MFQAALSSVIDHGSCKTQDSSALQVEESTGFLNTFQGRLCARNACGLCFTGTPLEHFEIPWEFYCGVIRSLAETKQTNNSTSNVVKSTLQKVGEICVEKMVPDSLSPSEDIPSLKVAA